MGPLIAWPRCSISTRNAPVDSRSAEIQDPCHTPATFAARGPHAAASKPHRARASLIRVFVAIPYVAMKTFFTSV